MIVVADTSPLNYLVLIGQIEILPKMFGSVILPRAVYEELLAPSAPEEVRAWLDRLPTWIEVRTASKGSDPSLGNLGVGEREAILIAEEIRADQLIMDDQRGRREARKRGIQAVGTLSVLQAAARAGLLDLSTALERLQRTNFFMSPRLVAETLKGEPPEKK